MASIEKLVKAFEALKVIQTAIDRPEEALVSTRFIKRETSLTKKDKTIHCNTIADIICCPGLRNIEDFHKFLGIAIETFLACCDDSDSDVRMNANDCLNRTIKNLLDTQLGRIQVELYKEIKKNGSSRSLRAALSRFADLCHLTRPAKCRPYVLNLFPCLLKISERTEEDLIQETLRIAMIKIMPVLATFATDNEIISLLTAFLPNLQFVMSSVRRTAASSLVVICQYSRKPQIFFSWLLSHLLQSLNQMNTISESKDYTSDQQTSDRIMIGIFLCVKHMIPHLCNIPSHIEYESLKTFGVSQKQREAIAKDYDSITENLLQIYELILHNIRFNNNPNIILTALEALLQIMKTPPKLILPYLIDSKGIDKSRIGTYIRSSPASPSMLSLHRHNRRMQSNNSISCSSINVESLGDDEEVNICGVTALDDRSDQSLSYSEPNFQRIVESEQSTKSLEDFNDTDIQTEYENYETSIELTRIENERTFASESETQSVKSMNKYSSSSFQVNTKLTYVEYEDSINDMQLSPCNTDSFDAIEERFNNGDIGEFVTENIPSLEYCVRLLCTQYLLNGTQGNLIPDRIVRVSVKSLALGCIAAVVRLHPKSLIIDVYLELDNILQKPGESPQKVWDILLFSTHSDPQLRGQIALVIGNFINEVLKEPLSYNKFLLLNCSITAYSEAPSLEELLNILSTIISDKNNSSVAIKHGLLGLKLCFRSLLESNDSINLMALSFIEQLIGLKDNPYWLLKAELVDVLSDLPYKVIHYLELLSKSSLQTGILVKQESIQEKIVNRVFFSLIADEDFRVREAVCLALVNLIPTLLTPIFHFDNDPITAIAFEYTLKNLPERTKSFQDLDNYIPPIQAFTDPLSLEKFCPTSNYLLETNLSNIVKMLLNGLQFNLDNKNALFGYCSALSLISEKYQVSQYPNSWGCDLSERSIATQLLNISMTLLSANMTVVLDLNTHQNLLILTGNILEGLAYNLIKTNGKNEVLVTELEWGIISSESLYLATHLESYFNHLLKIMNIYSCIIDESFTSPNIMSSITSNNKMPVIQTLSNSTLSPIRKKQIKQNSDLGDKSEGIKKSDSEKLDKDKNSKLQFASNTIYLKLFEMLRASYLSGKTSMDLKADKISSLLNVTLSHFSRLLEIATIKFISKYSEELLLYLKTVFTLEPSLAVKNVRQLLKCIFGTNFTVMFSNDNNNNGTEIIDDSIGGNANRSSFSGNRTISNSEFFGLYNCCLSSPYTKFTQLYASMSSRMSSSFSANDETDLTFSSWLRKKVEKRVSLILDKNMTSANSSISQNTKAALTSHIRLFEPVVIKALKQYTVTSDIRLQCEVLDLLSQLVQLRVNYCLLDSEQIFIGFVLKQFEFIESGQFDNYHELIGHIFFFLTLLSYERYHSKPIIGIPKIIQLCDGIIASGQLPEKFASPSLQCIVEDLILLRNASKVDSSKELETQREVIVANCLKLVQFPKILQILLIVTKQSKKEGEEKWKKISRQIIDILLPQLIKQSIQIDSYDSLEILHSLFESVSPSVFRPVDILLKALFAAPQPHITDNYYYFHRWTAMILVILRILIVQAKEEVVIARLEEMKSSIVTIGPFGLPVIPTSSFSSTNSIPFHMSSITNQNESFSVESEEMFASYLLQIIQLCTHEISTRNHSIYKDIISHCDFLVQQLANYLLILTHMFQSGSFRRVAKAAMGLIKKSQSQESDNCNTKDSYFSGFSLSTTNSSFMSILPTCPTLSLQWFNLLMLLNYEDNNEDGLWNKLIRPNSDNMSSLSTRRQSVGKRRGSANKIKNSFVFSSSIEIIRRGSLILFCDFVCENMNDAEHMTWLIVQNINEIIKMCFELPVSEFISAIHRNSASSGLFIQAINARCDENLKIPSFVRRLLKCLERVHPTQSASLITFLVEKIISNESLRGNYLLMRNTEDMACNRLDLMTSSIESFPNETFNQMTVQDINKLISSVNASKYSKLVSKLESLKSDINESNVSHVSQTSHPLLGSDKVLKIPDINKDWFLTILNKYCRKHVKGHRAAYLLNKLSYDDIISVLSSDDFALEILRDCVEFGDQSLIDENDKSNTKIMFSAVMNRINLLKASLNTVVQHVNYFANVLPSPHYPFLPHSEMSTPKEARHRDKIIELFSQKALWDYLFRLSLGFLSFLEHHSERVISSDLLKNITRIAVLYSETAQFMTEAVDCSSLTQVIAVLKIMKAAMNCGSIFSYLSTPENISYQCSVITSIHSFAQHFYGELPKFEEPENFAKKEKENSEWKHPHRACIRMSQLVCFVENNKHDSTHVPPIISSLIRKIILSTARLPLVNSFVMVPISMWTKKYSNTWNPSFSGDFGTVVPTIPSEFLQDKEILDQFSFRIMRLGWISRVQFEEIWMSLLGVFGVTSAHIDSNDEQSEHINISLTSAKAISELLLLSTLSPQPGNPIRSKFIKQKNEKLPTFLHTTYGVKLQLVREPLSNAINALICANNETETNVYDFGQISIELLRHNMKITSNSNELSPSVSSTSSSSGYSPLSPVMVNRNISSNQEKLEIDLNSCLHFLLDLYGQLLTSQQSIQIPLLTEICRSTVLLSDLFYEKTQFEWLLDTFLELHRMSQISEDEIMSQYLIVGICKSAAVLGLETEAIIDKCKKCIEISLKSHFLPTRIATLHGLKYILEFRGAGANGKETLFLPIASDYLLKHLSDNSLPSSHNSEHVEQMWKLSFHLIENFVEDFSESDFAQKIFQLSLKVLTDKNSKFYYIVVNGLEHLLICEKFTIKESNLIVKSALDRFKSSNCQIDALMSLSLISSSTYFVGSIGLDLEKNIDDSEEFLLAMEKLSVIFERLKNCLSFEAQQICNILPHFLCEFFPTQDILNKCIGEFLSKQQTHAKHLANVLFVVFNRLQIESRLDIVHDWVILSLSSFTQLIPLSHAIWSLTSFLISASLNPWIRYTFPYVQTRFGLLEDTDRELFFIVCYNFYNELKNDQNREAFRTTFQSIAEIDSPYSEVLRYLQIQKS